MFSFVCVGAGVARVRALVLVVVVCAVRVAMRCSGGRRRWTREAPVCQAWDASLHVPLDGKKRLVEEISAAQHKTGP